MLTLLRSWNIAATTLMGPSRNHLTAIIGFAVVIWAIVLWLQGVSLSWPSIEPYLKPFGISVSATYIALVFFDNWLWRSSILRPWFVKRPVIHGTWRAVLQSTYKDANGNIMEPIDAFWVIRQTYSTMSVRLFTARSSSISISAEIVERSGNAATLAVTYQNDSAIALREESPIHYGAALVELVGQPCKILDGQYWTDRATKGSIHIEERRRTLYVGSYDEGVSVYESEERRWWQLGN